MRTVRLEQKSIAKLRDALGPDADLKAFLALDAKLREIMLADIGPAMERWQDEAERLVHELNAPKKPRAAWQFAIALAGYAAGLIIANQRNGEEIPKESFLEMCSAVWDTQEELTETLRRSTF